MTNPPSSYNTPRDTIAPLTRPYISRCRRSTVFPGHIGRIEPIARGPAKASLRKPRVAPRKPVSDSGSGSVGSWTVAGWKHSHADMPS